MPNIEASLGSQQSTSNHSRGLLTRRNFLLASAAIPLSGLLAACSDSKVDEFLDSWNNWKPEEKGRVKVRILNEVVVVDGVAERCNVPKPIDQYAIQPIYAIDNDQVEVARFPFVVTDLNTGGWSWIAYYPQGRQDIVCVRLTDGNGYFPVSSLDEKKSPVKSPLKNDLEVLVKELEEVGFTSLGGLVHDKRYRPLAEVNGRLERLGTSYVREKLVPTPVPTFTPKPKSTPHPTFTPLPTITPTPRLKS